MRITALLIAMCLMHPGFLRLSAQGILDQSFGFQGTVRTAIGDRSGEGSKGNAVAIAPDQRIVVAGSCMDATGPYHMAVARYMSDGSLDTTFHLTGTRLANFTDSTSDWANAVAIQQDGRILLGGITSPSGGTPPAFLLLRLKADGSNDTTFGSGGWVRTHIVDPAFADDQILALAIESGGKIVAAGSARDVPGNFGCAFARYNTDGSLDTTFGDRGKVFMFVEGGAGSNDFVSALAIQPDGRIVGAGGSYSSSPPSRYTIAVLRLKADGTPDSAFGQNGSVRTYLRRGEAYYAHDAAYGVALDSAGKIVVAGTFEDSLTHPHFAVVRYDTNGAPDATFGDSGAVMTSVAGGNSTMDIAFSVAVQDDGKIVAAGESRGPSNQNAFAAVRYNEDGTPDDTFSPGGSVRVFIQGSSHAEDIAEGVAIQKDGRIVLAGQSKGTSTSYYFGLARLLPGEITGIRAHPASGPARWELSQNYPNPFNPSTTIKYTLPHANHVTLKIYDIFGRELKTLVNRMQEAGYKSVQFNASGFASGIYFYRLQAGTYVETKKLVVIR